MKGKEWGVVIGVVIVVAVVASLLTASITGNTIRQNNYWLGKSELYTKGEIDSFLKNKIEEINIIREKIRRDSNNVSSWRTCLAICNDNRKKCFSGTLISGVLTHNVSYNPGGVKGPDVAYYQLNAEINCKENQPFRLVSFELPPTSGHDTAWLWEDAYLSCSCY